MKFNNKVKSFVLGVSSLVLLAACGSTSAGDTTSNSTDSEASNGDSITIEVVAKGFQHQFWKSVNALVDPADAHQGKVDLELVDEVDTGLAHHATVTAHIAAGEQHIEVVLGAEHGGNVEVVGDDFQVVVIEQRTGDGFGGGADVDEQRGVIGNLRGDGFTDALLLVAHLVGTHGVRGVLDTGVIGCAAVVAAQQVGVRQLVDIAADGLRGDNE